MSKTTYPKPFKTYDEMISILESRNILVPDKEFAKTVLSDYSYYSIINGTQLFFERKDDVFLNQVTFFEIFLVYLVMSELSNTLLKYILIIENSMKSHISYRISEQYGVNTDIDQISLTKDPNDYLCIANFCNRTERNNILLDIKKKAAGYKNKNKSIDHYLTHHHQLPMWILTNCMTFGQIIKFYQIMKPVDKSYVVSKMVKTDLFNNDDERKEFIITSLNILRDYRNSIAHGNRPYTAKMNYSLKKSFVISITKSLVSNQEYRYGIGTNDIFAVMIILSVLLPFPTKGLFFSDIETIVSSYGNNIISGKPILELLKMPHNISDIIDVLK